MANKMPFDEVNALKGYLTQKRIEYGSISEMDEEEIVDTVLDILIMSYVFGTNEANEILGTNIKPDVRKMKSAVYKKYDKKDFSDRVREYAKKDDVDGIIRVAETDTTRIYNDGVLNAGVASGKKLNKRWETMLDDRVRDTHEYLQGMTIPLKSKFFTFDGDSADYPGGFSLAENNVNCRCRIELVEA